MHVIFQKTGSHIRTVIERDDGTRWSLLDPTRKFSPPYDFIHFVAETELGLQNGFFGTIAAGGVFESMRHIDGRRPPNARRKGDKAVRNNAATLVHAECVIGRLQEGLLASIKPQERVSEHCLAELMELEIEKETVHQVWHKLLSASTEWERVPIGQSISKFWN